MRTQLERTNNAYTHNNTRLTDVCHRRHRHGNHRHHHYGRHHPGRRHRHAGSPRRLPFSFLRLDSRRRARSRYVHRRPAQVPGTLLTLGLPRRPRAALICHPAYLRGRSVHPALLPPRGLRCRLCGCRPHPVLPHPLARRDHSAHLALLLSRGLQCRRRGYRPHRGPPHPLARTGLLRRARVLADHSPPGRETPLVMQRLAHWCLC